MKKRISHILILCLMGCLLLSALAGCNETYKVTFDLNYEGAAEATTVEVKGGEKAAKPADPTQEGYLFDGWYTDAAGTTEYTFPAVDGDITVYAKWKNDPNFASVTFVLGENMTDVVKRISIKTPTRISKPTDITRDGYELLNWYTDESMTKAYNFGLVVSSDLSLYAKWAKQHTFEAEYNDGIRDLSGPGWSGKADGLEMILKDKFGSASNGYFVSYLYSNGLELVFTINNNSTVDVTGVRLNIRMTTQYMNLDITKNNYEISVNGLGLDYGNIKINHDPGDQTGSGMTPFEDFLIADNLTLKPGANRIVLRTANNQALNGTTITAMAPVIDCIKLTTDADLTWTTTGEGSYNANNLIDAGLEI